MFPKPAPEVIQRLCCKVTQFYTPTVFINAAVLLQCNHSLDVEKTVKHYVMNTPYRDFDKSK